MDANANRLRLDRDPDAPLLFAVWAGDEIMGAGNTADEALAEARRTLEGERASRLGSAS